MSCLISGAAYYLMLSKFAQSQFVPRLSAMAASFNPVSIVPMNVRFFGTTSGSENESFAAPPRRARSGDREDRGDRNFARTERGERGSERSERFDRPKYYKSG